MLTDEQRKQLAQCIFNHLGLPPAPSVLEALVGVELARSVPNFNQAFGYSEWVVKSSLAQAKPDLLIKVIVTVDAGGTLQELHRLVTKLREKPDSWKTPQQRALWVPDDRPFVDRDEIRKLLRSMAGAEGPPAITIEGGVGEGKSTIAKYIEWLAKEEGTFKPIVRAFRAETADRSDLLSLAADLRLALKLDLEATDHAEPEREADLLATDIVFGAATAPKPVWLVVDGVDPSHAAPGVLRFIDELVGAVQDGQAGAKLRIVLLTERRVSSLGLQHLPPIEARKALPPVTADCLKKWLEAAVPGRDAALYGLTAKHVLQKLERKLQQPNISPAKRLEWLARHVAVAHARLEATGANA